MRFSVIIATLGRPHILKRTIESVARCDPSPDELIVVDGDLARSSEGATAGEYPFPVRYLVADPGLPKQRNAGIDQASGDVLVFIDDDVEIPIDTFATLRTTFADEAITGATARIIEPATERIGKKHSPARRLLPGGGEEGRFTRFGYPRRLIDLDSERDIDFMHGSFMTVRADVAREVRFDERLPGYALAEDEDFSYRVSRRGRIRFLPQLHVIHAKEGHGTRDARAFGRTVVINRSYLFRKNFRRTPVARAQFMLLIVMFMGHRLVNREWSEFRGLVEGAVRAFGRPLEREGRHPASTDPRVLFVSSHARAGGSERYLATLVSLLDPHRVVGVVALEDGPLVDILRAAGRDVDIVRTPGRPTGIIRSSLALRRHLRTASANVIHANGVKAALACVLARPRVPVVWVKHDFSYDGWLARFVARRCAAVVGVSEAVLAALGENARRRAQVVYSGVEVPAIDRSEAGRDLRAELGITPEQPLVGIVGRMHPVKGYGDFIAAARKAATERPDVQFIAVGGEDESYPEHANEIRMEAAALGERIRFLGHRNDAPAVMAGLDIGVMTSHRAGGTNVEALPLTVLEMLACGTPVVAYASGGIPEAVGDCGSLVGTGDVDTLAAALVELVDDVEARRRMSRCGRLRIESDFSLHEMISKMDEIYVRLAGA